MTYKSILMKEIKVLENKVLFGEALFSIKLMPNLEMRMFETFDEKVLALKIIILNMSAILTHKRQNESIDTLWNYINTERRKDNRINKSILKKITSDSFYYFHERKAKKLTVREVRSNYSAKYLDSIGKSLNELRYKMDDNDYNFCKERLLLAIKSLFKTNSEFGHIPVIKHNNILLLEKFYTSYPELMSLNISQSDSSDQYFSMMLRIWNLTKNREYLKDLDIAFERLKSSNKKGYQIDVERELEAIVKSPEYKNELPHFEKFQKTKNYLQFIERDVIQWDIEISVLQKWAIGLKNVSLSSHKFLNDILWLTSWEVNDLEICKPLNNVYMDVSQSYICFIFNKKIIKNEDIFEKYWLSLLENIIFESDKDKRILVVETINKEYLLDLELPEAQGKNSMLRKF